MLTSACSQQLKFRLALNSTYARLSVPFTAAHQKNRLLLRHDNRHNPPNCTRPLIDYSYGLLQAASQVVAPGEPYTIWPSGTDMIVTMDDGTVVAYDPGDSAYIMLCGALIFYMIPGVALLYSGLVRRKNALSLLLLCLLALAITAFQCKPNPRPALPGLSAEFLAQTSEPYLNLQGSCGDTRSPFQPEATPSWAT